MTDETLGRAELFNALKPFLGALPASAAVHVAGLDVTAPGQPDGTRCRHLLLRAGALA